MKAQTIQWWTFDTNPLLEYPDAPAVLEVRDDAMGGDGIGLTPYGEDNLPEDVAARLVRLAFEDFDSGSCEANACGFNYSEHSQGIAPRPGARPNTVGYALYGEADEDTRWHQTTIVKIPDGRLVVVCEDCDPQIVYVDEAPDPAADEDVTHVEVDGVVVATTTHVDLTKPVVSAPYEAPGVEHADPADMRDMADWAEGSR